MRNILLLLLSFTTLVNLKTLACSPYGTPIVTSTVVGNSLNISVTSTSGWSCCYHYQLELICNAASFTGVANYGFGTPIANSPTLCKPNPSNIAYPVYSIDLSQLCPGVTYKFQLREKHTGYTYWSNWSAINTFTITGPAYSVDVAANQTLLCPPDCAELTATAANACGAVNYTWNPAVGNGANQTVCPTVPTTYTVTGSMNVPFCPIAITSSAAVSIGIEPIAVAGSASLSPQQICSGQSTTLTLTGHTGSIQWQSSGSPSGPFTNIGGATSTTFVTGPITQDTYFQASVSTCNNEVSNIVSVQVFEIPTANFVQNNVCLADAMTFTDQSVDNISVDGWSWNFDDGSSSVQQNPSHTYTSPGDYTVTLEVVNPNGCTNQFSQLVTVYPIPVASFDFTQVCEDQLTQFTSTSTVDSSSTITGYSWDINVNGTVDYTTQNPTHSFGGPGQYDVSLYVETAEGCNNEITQQLLVYPLAVSDFSFNEVCFGNQTDFINSSSVVTGNIINYDWSFGDGNTSNLQSPSHTYSNTGSYNVTLTLTTDNGCVSAVTIPVNVFAVPVADFTFDNECYYDSINFSNTSTGASIYSWDFGDASPLNTQQNPSYQYNQPNEYNVTLMIYTADGCGDTITQQVIAYPQPQAQFSVDPVCFQLNSEFNDLSSIVPVAGDEIDSWSWNSGSGFSSNLQNPGNLFSSEGVYPISLTVTTNNGCSDTFTDSAIVWPLPDINFTPSNICLGEIADFTNLSTISTTYTPNELDSWSWDFGDGNTSNLANPTHLYASDGSFNVTLNIISSNGCENSETFVIDVLPQPVAEFVANPLVGTPPLTVFFDNNSSNGNSYSWDFGNNSTASNSTPEDMTEIYFNTGNYNVNLVVSNGLCENSASALIQVFFPPMTYVIPNIITPNGDNSNDRLHFNLNNAESIYVEIMNRWGQLVGIIDGIDNDQGWDGTYINTGKPVSDGVYFYKYEMKALDGEVVIGQAYVHLKR